MTDDLEDMVNELGAEVERLRADNAALRAEKIEANLEFAEVQVERERELRAERDLWEERTKQGAEIIEENVKIIERLRAAAMPFAVHDWMDAELEDDNCKLARSSGFLTVGHWRALRRALEEGK